jgi:hypothetical protein
LSNRTEDNRKSTAYSAIEDASDRLDKGSFLALPTFRFLLYQFFVFLDARRTNASAVKRKVKLPLPIPLFAEDAESKHAHLLSMQTYANRLSHHGKAVGDNIHCFQWQERRLM